MPTANTLKQRRWRQRHLGHDMARLQVLVSLDAPDQLDRLCAHYGYTVTYLVEQLAASAEKHIEAKLSGGALDAYRAGYEEVE